MPRDSKPAPALQVASRGPRPAGAFLAALGAAMLVACGGGGTGSQVEGPASCAVSDQKTWLADYMNDWYYWAPITPDVRASAYADTQSLFDAALFTGNATFPADRWSYTSSTSDYEQFFGDGESMGYGIFLAGLEVADRPDLPLRVRFVEAGSPAAGRVQRGDTVVSANGVPAAEMIAAEAYDAFSPTAEGQPITLVLRRGGTEFSLVLNAAVYALTPVHDARVLTSPLGRRVGYLGLKDFISQARTPLDDAFASFRSAGVQDLVLDLRYNGGGLVSVAGELASYVVGSTAVGQTFTTLRFNAAHADEDVSWNFARATQALGLSRVYVLTGERTCSASELVVNGLRPFVDVVQVGGTTCGKPVGFVPVDACGTTYSAVNFESVNAANQGRYWDGLAPRCAVADDVDHAQGDPAEALTATALGLADGGVCASAVSRDRAQSLRARLLRPGPPAEPAEPQSMILR